MSITLPHPHIAKSKSYLINHCYVIFFIPKTNSYKLECWIKGLLIEKKIKVGEYKSQRKTQTELYLADTRVKAIIFYNKAIDEHNGNMDWDWPGEFDNNKKINYGSIQKTTARASQRKK